MEKRLALAVIALLAIAGFIASEGRPASAGTFVTVTKTADTNDGSCDSDCSLREAVIAANTVPNVGGVDIPAGTYVLTLDGDDEDAAATGDLDITESVNINGDSNGGTIIDGGGLERTIDNLAPSLVMDDLTLTNSDALDVIWNREGRTVTMTEVVIRDNQTEEGYPAFTNSGNATLRRVTVTGNMGFGGIDQSLAPGGVASPALTIDDSTISNNTSGYSGGGLRASAGTVTITNSTFSGNFAAAHGGAISLDGGLGTFRNVTIVNNTSDADSDGNGDGGGIWTNVNGHQLTNTIIGGNNDPGGEAQDCATANNDWFSSLGHNLIQSTGGCTINDLGATDITGLDPTLLPLADNGGPTLTHLPGLGSPVIDAADDAACPDADQRGEPRPQGSHCDIGAVEVGLQPGQRLWGDGDCDGDVDSVDALGILRFVAGLPPLKGGNPCLPLGVAYTIAQAPNNILFGDLNCDGEVNAVDALAALRHVAGLSPIAADPCPDVGSIVQFVKT